MAIKIANASSSAGVRKPTPKQNAASTARYARPTQPASVGRNIVSNAISKAVSQSKQRQAPRPAPTPYRGGGGGGSYGGGGYGGGGGGSSLAVAAPKPPSENDWLKSDKSYQATLAALASQLKNFNADITAQLSNRKVDYDNALKQLGYVLPADAKGQGTWLFEDSMTAAGRAYQSMLNDFASRGMIQSQAYGDAQEDLTRTLNNQFEGLQTANNQFIDDMKRQQTKATSENTSAQQAARAESILRRAAQYGFGV